MGGAARFRATDVLTDGRAVGETIFKHDLFTRLGYGGAYDLLEAALREEGLSRPDKTGIAADKEEAVRAALARRFVIVCSRGDCQAEISGISDGRTAVPASSREECAVCGGSANRRAVDAMVAAFEAAGLRRLCVVGGSPNARAELERLVGGRLDLRLVDGTGSRTGRQARADVAWADRVGIWGSTQLAHRVSIPYRGPHVIQMARRSIQELAAEMARSVR